MSFEKALSLIADQESRLRAMLVPDPNFRKAFVGLLSEIHKLGFDLRVTVIRRDPKTELAVYRAPNAAEHETDAPERKEIAPDERAVTSSIEAWHVKRPRLEPHQIDQCMRRIGELANLHWGDRDPMTLLPYLKSPGTDTRLLAFAAASSDRDECVAVLHTDLDNFKAINTEFTEPGGDAVLTEFAGRFRNHFSELGVVIRTAGEEFSAVLRHRDPMEILVAVEAFRRSMEIEPLATIGRPNTCSIGLSIYDRGDVVALCGSFDGLMLEARAAEVRAKQDGKNCIRLSETKGEPETVAISSSDLVRAAIAARLNLDRPGSSPTRDDAGVLLGRLVANQLSSSGSDAQQAAQSVARAVGVTLAKSPELAAGKPPSLSFVVRTATWAASVAWGYLRSAYIGGTVPGPSDIMRFEIRAGEDKLRVLALVIDAGTLGETVIPIGKVPADTPNLGSIEIGRPWYPAAAAPPGSILRFEASDIPGSECPLSPCVLLPIGDAAIGLAKGLRHLVADVVEIDDRPVIGGGLPDFWQSNVARTVRSCLRNPNVQTIIVLGTSANADATLRRLELADATWSREMHDLQRRLSISLEHLLMFRERGIQIVRIEQPSEEGAYDAIFAANSAIATRASAPPTVNLEEEAKRRRISVAPQSEGIRLLPTDGLRTKTLTDAYPQAINLLRSSDAPPQVETSLRRFREFPSFKLVLTTPYIETVPDYWKGEQPALDHYFERNFGRQASLFGTRLYVEAPDGSSLYQQGLDATVDAIRAERPTRRIFLPISAVDGRFDQPLGLCAIQVMPRFREGRCHLDFQWIWRTVEAIVGFPFSAYGSIAWSRKFYNAVLEELVRSGASTSVELGELTYLALSFHMFLDVGDTEIARAIVQDVSY